MTNSTSKRFFVRGEILVQEGADIHERLEQALREIGAEHLLIRVEGRKPREAAPRRHEPGSDS